MSELDKAMEEHMAGIVRSQNKPFSFRDFLNFEVDGKEYRMAHGTYRNKIAALKKLGKVEPAYNAGLAFHTLKGKQFGKPMTSTHEGVCNSKMDSFSRLISDLPIDRAALHNIRLKFQVEGIWFKFSSHYPQLPVRDVNKDICVPTWNIGELLIRTVVHRSDTVTVTIACSLTPVAMNIKGFMDLSNALTRVEERLNVMLRDIGCGSGTSSNGPGNGNETGHLNIPDHKQWVVIMWHLGADSLVEYTGEKFAMTWETGKNALIRAYTKVMKDKRTRIRLERQECPKKIFQEIMEEKLNAANLLD
jgi:hypothetical protein